jgi:hypothetical protein
MSGAQRLGIGMVALFQGLLAACAFLAIAILVRNGQDLLFMLHHFTYAMQVIVTSCFVEAIICSITWFAFASWPIVFISPETIRRHRWQSLLAALPLALCAPGVFALLLLYAHHKTATVPTLRWTVALVTFFYMGITAMVAIYQYMSLTLRAEENITGERLPASEVMPPDND